MLARDSGRPAAPSQRLTHRPTPTRPAAPAPRSVFISYRVASELPLARLLFDELNHAVTPGGHRVTVYLDAQRLVKACARALLSPNPPASDRI
jgi:hypothetical protein